jgi:hypothetical protein
MDPGVIYIPRCIQYNKREKVNKHYKKKEVKDEGEKSRRKRKYRRMTRDRRQ